MDKFPLGVAFAKGLTFKMGQTNVHRYLGPLLERHLASLCSRGPEFSARGAMGCGRQSA